MLCGCDDGDDYGGGGGGGGGGDVDINHISSSPIMLIIMTTMDTIARAFSKRYFTRFQSVRITGQIE